MLTVVTTTAPEVEVSPEAAVPERVRAPPVRPSVALARIVPPEASVIVRVPPHRIPRVASVKVCEVPADEVKVTLKNSSSERFALANVIVPPVAESKSIVPLPASHVASVEELVQVPETVQLSEPKSMALPTAEMFTLPETEAVPEVEVMSPPDIVRAPWTVRVAVPLASVLALSVRESIVIAAAPEVVREAETVAAPTSSAPVEIVMVPPEWVNVPVLVKLNEESANVPANP